MALPLQSSAPMPLVLSPHAYRWNVNAIPWAVVALGLLILALVIFARQRASVVGRLYCLMIALVALWFAGFTGMFLARSGEAADCWARLALFAVCFLPGSIYVFTVTALRLFSRRRLLVAIIWIASAVFGTVTLFTSDTVGRMELHSWGWYPLAGPLLGPFLFFFWTVLAAQVIEGLVEQRRTADVTRRQRIGRLLLPFVIAYFSGLDFLPMFGFRNRPIAYIPILLFVWAAWTSIRHHRLPSISAARASREILDTMADALFVIDADARIRVMNGAVITLLGFEESDLLGRSIDTLEASGEDRTISRTLHDLAHQGPIRDQERIFRQKEGGPVDVSVSISPVSDGQVQQGAVVIARDIRERKRAERELHSFMDRLKHSNRELEDFAHVASHDLQEPLRKIQAFGDLLKSKHAMVLPPQGRDYVDRMQSAAQRMQVLINDLLVFSRVTTKAQPFRKVDLTTIAHEVARDLEARTHEVGGRIVIGDLPRLYADPLQMRQLLQNLAANALKFQREGVPPLVEMDGQVEGLEARIVVRDNGIGFEAKYADRIFTMFERLHGRSQYEGTGIGLAICRKIAERHGGSITARSTPGEGSTFILTLPVQHENREEAVAEDTPAPQEG